MAAANLWQVMAGGDQRRAAAPARWHYGWTLVAVAFVSAGAAFGARAAYGVLLGPLAETFGAGRGMVAAVLGLNALVAALTAPLWGVLLDRHGPRRVFASAGLLTALGLAVAALTQATWQLYVGVGVVAGLGYAPFQVNAQSVVLANWFVRHRGLAVGIVAAGTGTGVLILAPLTQWIIDRTTWHLAFLALAALFAVGIAPLNALLQRHRPSDGDVVSESGHQTRAAAAAPARAVARPSMSAPTCAPGPTLGQALRHPRFWALAVGLGCGALTLNFLMAHTVAHLVDVGFSPSLGAGLLGTSGAGAAGGMILGGYVADRWGAEWYYTAGSLALIASCGLLAVVTPEREGLLYVYPALLAVGFASRQGLIGFSVAALAAGRSLGAITGVVAAHVALGIALGPALGGWLFDRTDSYQAAFVLASAVAALSTVGIWLAAPRRGSLLGPIAAPLAPAVESSLRPGAITPLAEVGAPCPVPVTIPTPRRPRW